MSDRRASTLDTAGSYFLSLVEAGQDCVRVLSPDGRLHHMNAHGRALLDLDEDHQHLGAYWPSLWPEDSRASVRSSVERGARGEASGFRAFCPTAKGRAKWWDTSVVPIRGVDGTVDWLLATSRDITEEIDTRSFLSTLLDLLPLSLMVKSGFDGRYVLINRAAEEMLGVEAGDIVGKRAVDLFPPAVAASFDQEDAEVLRDDHIRTTLGEAVVMPNGDLRFFDTKKVATQGQVRHVIAVGEDVTERHLASLALQAALGQAEAASQAKMAFLSSMSHEIRTPLNGVIGLAESLARGKLAESERRLARMIQASARTLQALLNDVLDLAGLDADDLPLEIAPFDLTSSVKAAIAPWRSLARAKGLRLVVRAAPRVMTSGDQGRVGQILGNLFSNAVKFTPSGAIDVSVQSIAGGARVCVNDTGVGFPADRAEAIFNRFERADQTEGRSAGGAGLGLAFARELAERMGGSIGCESRAGHGSRFWLDLPLAPDRPGEDPATEASVGRPLRCLLADDHPTNRLVVETMLGPIAQVVSVENGALALEAFQNDRFDVVLMDLQMPVMDGLTAIRAIRNFEAGQDRARTPVIVLSASGLPQDVDAARRAGADQHLAKPIRMDTLLLALQDSLGDRS